MTTRTAPGSCRHSGERGSALMEYAIVLPLLLILMFSIIDFGLYFFATHTVQYATREGVRLALVGGTLLDPSGNVMSREASIVQRIRDKASIAVPPGDLEISVYPVAADYGDPPAWQGARDAGMPGQYMRVRARHRYRIITPFIRVLTSDGTLPIRAEATYRNELFTMP